MGGSERTVPGPVEEDLTCRLLSLPPEIRDMIYRQLLVPTGTLEIGHARRPLASKTCCRVHPSVQKRFKKQQAVPVMPGQAIFIRSEQRPQMSFAILRTCRQIHDEALARFYEDTTFKYLHLKCIYFHLAAIGPRHRALIRHIEFSFHCQPETRWVGLIPQCAALRTLNIIVDSDLSGAPSARSDRRIERGLALVDKLRLVRGLTLLSVRFQEKLILAPHLTQDRTIERRPLETFFDTAYLNKISLELQELMRWPRKTPIPSGRPGVRSSQRLAKMREIKQ